MIRRVHRWARVDERIADRPIVAFAVLAFGWTWGWDLLVYAVVGPSPPIFVPPTTMPRTWGLPFAAAVVLWARGESVRGFLRRTVTIPRRSWLLAVGLLLPVAIGELYTALAALAGVRITGLAYPAWAYVANFLLVLLFAGSLEEFGWRAFAQPTLQRSAPAVLVAVGIGMAWATWHLPLFFLFELEPYAPAGLPTYYLTLVLESVVLAWLFNETGGSVLAPMVFHAASNLPGVLALADPPTGLLATVGNLWYPGILAVLSLVLVVTRGTGLANHRLPSDHGP